MSYADLITLLLAVFVLLFSLASIDSNKVANVTKAIATYLNTKTVENTVSIGDVSLQERQMLALRLLSTYLDLGHPDQVLQKLLTIQENTEEIKKLQALAERLGLFGNAKLNTPALKYEIIFPERILFDQHSPYMTKSGLRILASLTPKIKEALAAEEKFVEIVAEVDGRKKPPTGFSSAHIFASARAEAVSLFIQKGGIPASRIQLTGRTSDVRDVAKPADAAAASGKGADVGSRLIISILTPQEQAQ
ncbi:MAG: Membrane MotB of proton-channel complex MotA/MotB [Pseudomonadota bacterium]